MRAFEANTGTSYDAAEIGKEIALRFRNSRTEVKDRKRKKPVRSRGHSDGDKAVVAKKEGGVEPWISKWRGEDINNVSNRLRKRSTKGERVDEADENEPDEKIESVEPWIRKWRGEDEGEDYSEEDDNLGNDDVAVEPWIRKWRNED